MIFDYEMFQFKLFSIIKYPAETVTISLLAHKLSNLFPSITLSIASLKTSLDLDPSTLKLK